MILAGRFSRPAIGVDFGARRVRAIQMDARRGRRVVRAAADYPRVEPGKKVTRDEVAYLRDLLDRQGFEGNDIVLALPGDALLWGILEMPPAGSGAPRGQIARSELARMHGCPPHAMEMCFWDLPQSAKAKASAQVMAAGYAHERAEEFLGVVESAGLSVRALDVHSCALVRACEPMLTDPQGLYAILDIGWRRTTLILVYAKVIVYVRKVAEGGLGELNRTLRERLDLEEDVVEELLNRISLEEKTDEKAEAPIQVQLPEMRMEMVNHLDALLKELEAPLTYAAHEYPSAVFQAVLLVGDGASLRGLGPHLSRALNVDVRTAAPSELARCADELLGRCGPTQATAMGLAQFKEDAAA